MRRGSISILAAIGLATIVALELQVWKLSREWEDLRAAGDEAAQAQATFESVRQGIEARHAVTARLAAGELSLAAATDELEPLLEALPGFDVAWQFTYRTPTFRLGVARYAIFWAAEGVAGNSYRAAEVAARLEEEFRAMVGESCVPGVLAAASGGSR